jgi:hypothetical protein
MDEIKRLEVLQRSLSSLDELMSRRNQSLSAFESRILIDMQTGATTLLNPTTRDQSVTNNLAYAASMRLECKMLRRALFFMRIRRTNIVAEIVQLQNKRADSKPQDTEFAS